MTTIRWCDDGDEDSSGDEENDDKDSSTAKTKSQSVNNRKRIANRGYGVSRGLDFQKSFLVNIELPPNPQSYAQSHTHTYTGYTYLEGPRQVLHCPDAVMIKGETFDEWFQLWMDW